jgi:hypothetical protein
LIVQTHAAKTDPRALRHFGLLMAGMIALVFGVLLPWVYGYRSPTWAWLVSAVFAIMGFARPAGLGPIYRIWMKFAAILGWINSRIILTVVYYLVVFPIGLLMRAIGKDPMARKFDERAATYRTPSRKAPREQLEKPF